MIFTVIDENGKKKEIDTTNIANILNKMDGLVGLAIQKLKTSESVVWNDLGAENIRRALKDFYDIRNYVLHNYINLQNKRDRAKSQEEIDNINKNLKTLTKVVRVWNTGNNSGNGMYYKLQKLQEAIDAYNARVPKESRIESVEEKTGYKINYSVKTNYFPY